MIDKIKKFYDDDAPAGEIANEVVARLIEGGMPEITAISMKDEIQNDIVVARGIRKKIRKACKKAKTKTIVTAMIQTLEQLSYERNDMDEMLSVLTFHTNLAIEHVAEAKDYFDYSTQRH